jgi:RNA polymerase sigma-70 factor (ECF subfamily)
MDYASLQPEELVQACAQAGQSPAWQEFIRRFNPLITRVALRTARQWGEISPPLIDDLVQETYLKLCAENCKLLRTFQSRQSQAFYGYLKVVTANIVHDHFKGARAAKRASPQANEDIDRADLHETCTSQRSPSSQASIERTILIQEIDQHLARLLPIADLSRSRLIFWLYYRSGLSASAIASLPGVGLTTKGVESALLRLTRLIRAAFTERKDLRKDNDQDSLQDQKGFPHTDSF